MVKSKSELLEAINKNFNGETTDEVISLIEDISDTLDDFETKTKDTSDWKAKYDELDKTWKEKYKARFFSSVEEKEKEEIDDKEIDSSDITIEELFNESED